MKLADVLTEMAAIAGDYEVTPRDLAQLLPLVMAGVNAPSVPHDKRAVRKVIRWTAMRAAAPYTTPFGRRIARRAAT